MARGDVVELLVPVGAGPQLVVLADDVRARRGGPHRSRSERADVQLAADADEDAPLAIPSFRELLVEVERGGCRHRHGYSLRVEYLDVEQYAGE
jgi:hypothetical protein